MLTRLTVHRTSAALWGRSVIRLEISRHQGSSVAMAQHGSAKPRKMFSRSAQHRRLNAAMIWEVDAVLEVPSVHQMDVYVSRVPR
jgi:hypothetical protein